MNNDIKGIHAYVYNKSDPKSLARHPVGVLAAQPSANDPLAVVIGWSRCNQAAGDRFDRKEGTRIAYARSAVGSISPVPQSMRLEYELFYLRAKRYFRDRKVCLF